MRLTSFIRFGLLLLAAVIAIVLYLRLSPYVMPTAALRLQVSAAEAEKIAARFLQREGVTIPRGYRHAVTFAVRSSAKAYLEQRLGIHGANRVMQTDGLIYAWNVRWFRPEQQEQFFVSVTPDGEILCYNHDIPDDAPAPPSSNPRLTAKAFVLRTAGVNLDRYALLTSEVIPLTNRQDHSYEWERGDLAFGDAKQRVRVLITGNQVSYYWRYLHLPEVFSYHYSREAQKGDLLANLAFALAGIFLLAGIVGYVIGMTTRSLYARCGLVAASLLALISLANALNLLPLTYAHFIITHSWSAFWLRYATTTGIHLLWIWGSTVILVIAAEWYYRRAFPRHRPLSHWFTMAGLGSRAGWRRLLLGYWLIPVQLAYLCVFYLLTEHFLHGWMPAAVAYSNLFSTRAPGVYALLIGVSASISEEFLFRVLAISWLKRLLKHDWLAVLIPAIAWGFAHCNYPNQPFFIRGIELTLWGIVFGWVFLRYGPLPTLIAHAGYDAVLESGSLLSSHTLVSHLNFAIVLLLVLAPLGLSYWLRRRKGAEQTAEPPLDNQAFHEQLQQRNRQQRQPELPPETDPAPLSYPRTARRLGLRVFCGSLILAATLAIFTQHFFHVAKPYHWQQPGRNPFHAHLIDRIAAVRIAARALQREHAQVHGWVLATEMFSPGLDDDQAAYLDGYLSEDDRVALLSRLPTPSLCWVVRWQKPVARDSWTVRLAADGRVWDIMHSVPEEAPGAFLTQTRACQLAETALRLHGFLLSRLRQTGVSAHAYPHRSYYDFNWEMPELQVGKAQFIIHVYVDGQRVNGIDSEVTVPDTYTFRAHRQTLWTTTGDLLSPLFPAILACWGWIVWGLTVRRYRIPWRSGLLVAAVGIPLILLLQLLDMPGFWSSLSATEAPIGFFINGWLQRGAILIVVTLGILALLPVLIVLWSEQFPNLPGPRVWISAFYRPWQYRAYWRSALLAHPILLSLALLGATIAAMYDRCCHTSYQTALVHIPDWFIKATPLLASCAPREGMNGFGIDTLFPPLYFLIVALLAGMAVLLSWLVLLAFAKRMFHTIPRALLALAVLLMGTTLFYTENPGDCAGALLAIALGVCGVWVGYRLLLRTNPLILFVSTTSSILTMGLSDLYWFPAYRPAALVCSGLLLAVYLWALLSAAIARHNEKGDDQRLLPPAVIEPQEMAPMDAEACGVIDD